LALVLGSDFGGDSDGVLVSPGSAFEVVSWLEVEFTGSGSTIGGVVGRGASVASVEGSTFSWAGSDKCQICSCSRNEMIESTCYIFIFGRLRVFSCS
jgi:hypothetical protein